MRESRFRVPGGLTLSVCAWGPDAGRPVVICHGFLEQAAAWDGVARRLARRVIAPDHRGHGRSDHAPPGAFYPFWDYVSDLDALLASLDTPVDLVGHSMGGTVSALLAATRPERVRRLVLIEGLGPPDAAGVAVEQARIALEHRQHPPRHPCLPDLDAAADRMRRFATSLDPAEARALAARVTRPVLPDDPDVIDPVPGGLTWTWDPRHRMRSPRAFDAGMHARFLAAITAPTLVVSGAHSVVRLPDAAARIGALRPTAVVHLDAGHLIHHDAPDALADALTAFLDEP